MPNYASQLGEAVGNVVEFEIQQIIQDVVAPYSLYVDVGGKRPGKRESQRLLMVNDTGIQYQIDLVVENAEGDPLILVESKYIRYKKHNRDKASWTCVAHYKLRTTYPTIKKSIAVVMGNWSEPSKKLMESFGVSLVDISFSELVDVLSDYGIAFAWEEKDNLTPLKSMRQWKKLTEAQKLEIGKRILSKDADRIRELVRSAIEGQDEAVENVQTIELLVKTSQEVYFLKKFQSIKDTISYLFDLTSDVENIKGRLK